MLWASRSPRPLSNLQWAGVLSRLALEQERILNPLLDRIRTADHHQLRSLTGLIRNLSRNARNKDEMCESGPPQPGARLHTAQLSSYLDPAWAGFSEPEPGESGPAPWGSRGLAVLGDGGLRLTPTSRQPPR